MARRRLTLRDTQPRNERLPLGTPRKAAESPLFPTVLWLALVALGVAVGYAAWRAVISEGRWLSTFVGELLWPGLAIFAVVFLVALAGWKLDID